MKLNKGFITVATLVYLTLSTPFAASIFVKFRSADRLYTDINHVPKKEVALVLGAAAYPSRLSDILKDRVDTAIELYQNDKVSKLIMTGAPNEVKGMSNYAIDAGILREDIIPDPKGLNTLASVRNAAGHKNMTIVTQAFHLPRALFMAEKHGINAIGLASDKREYAKMVSYKKRELLATTKAMLDLYFLK